MGMTRVERIEGGLWGLLVGDAAGVPYEFREPWELPAKEQLGPRPPAGFVRSYQDVPLGTWSDDGAQALALLDTLLSAGGRFDAVGFGRRLLAWRQRGVFAVGGRVFDIGVQTGAALNRLAMGTAPESAGLGGERNNGNGSLMRVLPLVLVLQGSDAELVEAAHAQSRLTHRHPRSLVCCALYCLWARGELEGWEQPWDEAVARLDGIYAGEPTFRDELRKHFGAASEVGTLGSGYCVDSLLSARLACAEASYAGVIREAIAFGRDTDTTAAIAGGIAGLRHGLGGIPEDWRDLLRGWEILDPLWLRLREYL